MALKWTSYLDIEKNNKNAMLVALWFCDLWDLWYVIKCWFLVIWIIDIKTFNGMVGVCENFKIN